MRGRGREYVLEAESAVEKQAWVGMLRAAQMECALPLPVPGRLVWVRYYDILGVLVSYHYTVIDS